MSIRLSTKIARLLFMGLVTTPMVAWCALDAGGQIRQFQDETARRIAPDKPSQPNPVPATPATPPVDAAASGGHTIHVESFLVHGVSQFTDAEVASVLMPFAGRPLDAGGIQEASGALQALYRRHGYFVARVYVPPQDVANVVQLDVVEGHLDAPGIEVVNRGQRVDAAVVRDILATHLDDQQPIHRAPFERALLIAEDLPGITTASTLYPGTQVGTARLRTVVTDLPLIDGNVDLDNHGSRATGPTRLGVTLYVNSPSRAGDQVVGRLVTSGHRSQYAYLAYLRPLSSWGTRWGASLDHFRYDADFITNLGYSEGQASDLRVYLTHPIVRSRHGNLNVRADLSHLTLDDRNDLDINARRDVDTLTVALQGDDDHPWLTTGLTTFNLSATLGQVDIRGNAAYRSADAATAETSGGFVRLNVNATRLTRLTAHWSLMTGFHGQWADTDLDSSQRFYLGGATSVSGYPTGEASGDRGADVTLELRRDIAPPWDGTLLAGVFYQQGWVRTHVSTWDGWQGGNSLLRNSFSLRTVGLNVLATVADGWVVRGTVGRQVGDNPMQDPTSGDASDGKGSAYRGWVQLIRYF